MMPRHENFHLLRKRVDKHDDATTSILFQEDMMFWLIDDGGTRGEG